MPSDPRTERALAALRDRREAFRTALTATVAEVRAYLQTQCTSDEAQVARLGAELGPFATERVDIRRLAALLPDGRSVDPLTAETMERALQTLTDVAAREDDLFLVDVPAGASLRDAVARALEDIGRVFGASRVIELSRTGRYRPAEHARSLGAFPYGRWSRAERQIAPPLVVEVEGRDLNAPGLAEFLDGGQKIVLVVRGDPAPAALVRLIAPNTFVAQSADPAHLDRLAAWNGPGIAALVSEDAAHFVHDPAAGGGVWERLTILRDPERAPRTAVGGISRDQQIADLEQLRALALKPAAPSGDGVRPAAAPAATDPAGKLAAWLLSQADLSESV